MYSGCTIRNTRSVNGWIVKTLGLLLITSLLLTGPGVAKASETSTFSDISGHKYEALIEQAAEDGWVNGCPDGRFLARQAYNQVGICKNDVGGP